MSNKKYDLPLGFGMALAQNEKSMERFATMSDSQKRAVIAQTSQIKSKSEMQEYVRNLGNNSAVN